MAATGLFREEVVKRLQDKYGNEDQLKILYARLEKQAVEMALRKRDTRTGMFPVPVHARSSLAFAVSVGTEDFNMCSLTFSKGGEVQVVTATMDYNFLPLDTALVEDCFALSFSPTNKLQVRVIRCSSRAPASQYSQSEALDEGECVQDEGIVVNKACLDAMVTQTVTWKLKVSYLLKVSLQ